MSARSALCFAAGGDRAEETSAAPAEEEPQPEDAQPEGKQQQTCYYEGYVV